MVGGACVSLTDLGLLMHMSTKSPFVKSKDLPLSNQVSSNPIDICYRFLELLAKVM